MNISTHKIKILKQFLSGAELSSSDINASNSNQYFVGIKNQGIELKEVWEANESNTGRHLNRSLVMEGDNIERAEKYLKKLQGRHRVVNYLKKIKQ